MALTDDLTSAVSDAFTAFADLKQTVTFSYSGAETYDPNTGTSGSQPSKFDIELIVVRFRASEIPNLGVQPNDRKVLIEATQLPLRPKQTDWINVAGERWEVVADLSPPVENTLYVLHVREAK